MKCFYKLNFPFTNSRHHHIATWRLLTEAYLCTTRKRYIKLFATRISATKSLKKLLNKSSDKYWIQIYNVSDFYQTRAIKFCKMLTLRRRNRYESKSIWEAYQDSIPYITFKGTFFLPWIFTFTASFCWDFWGW